jgi:formylglycine-generating enzyme required for sulfatase activity
MPFCPNCGHQLTDKENFCPKCGHKIKHVQPIPIIPEENIPPGKSSLPLHKIDHTFTLLEPGAIFNKAYKIEKVIGKDNDGISYLAIDERNNAICSLKLFYQSYFDNVDKLLGSIVRISKIKSIIHPNIAKVYEVNQTFRPAYIASEYIDGSTLAEIKERNPLLFTEEYVREVAKYLISAAITIRKAGLAVRNLNLQNIVRANDGRIIILSTGINYDVGEEREDIFNIGIVLAKLFSKSAFYETVYVPLRLIERKFDYISGITLGANDILAECLQKNLNQRFSSFEELAKALEHLKPVANDEIYISNEDGIRPFKDDNILSLPTRKLDPYFWGIIAFILIFICILMFTNILDTLFGEKPATFKFTGFMTSVTDTVKADGSVADDSYRRIKTNSKNMRSKMSFNNNQDTKPADINPNVNIPPPQPIFTTTKNNPEIDLSYNQASIQKKAIVSENLVYLNGDTFAFGNLRKDARDNVSLNGFYISKSEVSQAEWNRYMKPANCSSLGDNLPVDNISWFDATMYCNARSDAEGLTPCYKSTGFGTNRVVTCNFKANGYRLPTEAEWEYAARAKRTSLYSGSDNPDQIAWYKENSNGHIHPIKTKSSNAFGLNDMTGNVYEWCWDWFDANYPKVMPFINPTGPASGSLKVIRGGSIETSKGTSLETIFRNKAVPARAYLFIGFRVVRAK